MSFSRATRLSIVSSDGSLKEHQIRVISMRSYERYILSVECILIGILIGILFFVIPLTEEQLAWYFSHTWWMMAPVVIFLIYGPLAPFLRLLGGFPPYSMHDGYFDWRLLLKDSIATLVAIVFWLQPDYLEYFLGLFLAGLTIVTFTRHSQTSFEMT